ncbi:RNA polymerase sigma factor [Phytohabitans aurantiacus]|uniref:sigma factor n=1 Tax=Phytohabitans aurantiacus TaxID=3016789 RepID=UPI00248FBA0A|nr:sigma factor [Phytohabitans aurantiacus]
MDEVTKLVDRIWRGHAASMLGALSRRLGDFDRAEDALAEALKRWPDEGVPDSPTGWLVTVGWGKALDRLRRDAAGREKAARMAAEPPPEPGVDDRLALIFACCHPDLAALPGPTRSPHTGRSSTGSRHGRPPVAVARWAGHGPATRLRQQDRADPGRLH